MHVRRSCALRLCRITPFVVCLPISTLMTLPSCDKTEQVSLQATHITVTISRSSAYQYMRRPAEEEAWEDGIWKFGPILLSQRRSLLTFDVSTAYMPIYFSTAWLLSRESRDWDVGLSVATGSAPCLFGGEQHKPIVPQVHERLPEPLFSLSFSKCYYAIRFSYASFGHHLYHMLQNLLVIFSSLPVVVWSDRCKSTHAVIFQSFVCI
jgi:hypothetical protein